MPGRGRPWKGVGEGVPDRIGTGAIKDGSITEADLDSSVTSKLNSTGHAIQDEGTPLTQQSKMNFVGAGVTASVGGEDTTIVTIPSGADGVGYDEIKDEGTPLTKRSKLNFIGTGVTAVDNGDTTDVTITQATPDGVGYDEAQDEGTPLTKRPTLDFVGAGVTVTDDSENTKTIVTIPGGGGGGVDRENVGSPNDDFWIYDEFFYPVFGNIDHLEHAENSGSIPSVAIGGVIQQNTTAVANGLTRLNTCGAGLAVVDGTKKVIVRWRTKLGIADANTSMICGLTDPNNGPQSTFPFGNKFDPIITFFWTGTGNIDTYSDDGSQVEQTDTGVAMDTAFHTYDIEFDPSGTPTITYKIDGNIVKTQTTNIPTGNMACYNAVQTGTTSSRSIQTDSWFLFNER